MTNLEYKAKKRKHAGRYGSGNRFYTALDMAIVKHDEAVQNAKIKRGEIKPHNNRYISVCGCGREGCFIHGSYENK